MAKVGRRKSTDRASLKTNVEANSEKASGLPDGKQQEVLALVESLLDKEQLGEPESTPRPISEVFEELSSQIQFEEWAELPHDDAEQHDLYLFTQTK